MVITGSYRLEADGTYRPIVEVQVQTAANTFQTAPFLVDSGVDQSVFSADLLAMLNLATQVPSGLAYLQSVPATLRLSFGSG
jgi:hypothetical protein